MAAHGKDGIWNLETKQEPEPEPDPEAA